MTQRVIDWISNARRARYSEPEVHFHSSPQSLPAACHDQHCGRPRLDVLSATT